MAKPDPSRKPSARKRMFWMLLITVLVFGGVFAVWGAMRVMMNRFFDDMPQPAVAVSTFEARAERWEGSLEAVGTLVAVNGTDVTAEAGGVVQKIAFEAGQPVKAGALLVELNSAAELATLEALDASARQARTQAERWRTLGRDKLVSQADVEERATQAATARAQAEAQRAVIAQKRVRAPFDGILGIRKVNLGQFVAPGDPIVSLQSLDPVFVNFSLPGAADPAGARRPDRARPRGRAARPRVPGTITAIVSRAWMPAPATTVQATVANPTARCAPAPSPARRLRRRRSDRRRGGAADRDQLQPLRQRGLRGGRGRRRGARAGRAKAMARS